MDASAQRKPALGFIFITLVLLVLGFGIIIPILPRLIVQFRGGSFAAGSSSYGLLVSVFAVMQFIASPILGSLSDRFGRRKIILLALAGSAIDYVIMGLAPNLAWLFVARIISGMTAGALATCNAYIADVTPPEKRAQAFGLVGAAFGFGFAIGPAIGGYLGGISLKLPFFVAAGCVGINWLYGAFVLPESLAPENRRPFSWKRANPVGSLLALRRFRGVFDLACMHFIFMSANSMLQSIWALYTDYRYRWSPSEVGNSLTLMGVMAIVVQGGFVRRIIAWTGERKGLVIGLVISAITLAAYGTATQGWMIYGLVLLGAWGGIAGPSAQALITKHVPANEQGGVQGSLSGLTSLAGIGAPIFAAWSFGKGIPNLPGVAFYEASVLILVALALAFRSFQLDDRVGEEA
jgi:DHA1 family tetracycline resistance protein-like MFS transporter